jgi:hypothetical protein
MTLTLAITINVLLDVTILGLLAYVMSRAGNLTPHLAVIPADAPTAPAEQATRPRARRRAERAPLRRHPVLD